MIVPVVPAALHWNGAFALLCGKRPGHVVVTPNMMCAEGSESQTFRTLELLLTSIHRGECQAQNHSAL